VTAFQCDPDYRDDDARLGRGAWHAILSDFRFILLEPAETSNVPEGRVSKRSLMRRV